jgi:hypothetical protein
VIEKTWDIVAALRGHHELTKALKEGWEPFAVYGDPAVIYLKKAYGRAMSNEDLAKECTRRLDALMDKVEDIGMPGPLMDLIATLKVMNMRLIELERNS